MGQFKGHDDRNYYGGCWLYTDNMDNSYSDLSISNNPQMTVYFDGPSSSRKIMFTMGKTAGRNVYRVCRNQWQGSTGTGSYPNDQDNTGIAYSQSLVLIAAFPNNNHQWDWSVGKEGGGTDRFSTGTDWTGDNTQFPDAVIHKDVIGYAEYSTTPDPKQVHFLAVGGHDT